MWGCSSGKVAAVGRRCGPEPSGAGEGEHLLECGESPVFPWRWSQGGVGWQVRRGGALCCSPYWEGGAGLPWGSGGCKPVGVMWPQAACTRSSGESLAQLPPSPLGWGCKSPPFQGQGGERDGDSCAMADPSLAIPGKTAGGEGGNRLGWVCRKKLFTQTLLEVLKRSRQCQS